MSILDMIGIWKGRMALLDPHGEPIAVAPPGVETFREFENLLAEVDDASEKRYQGGCKDSYGEGHTDGFIEGRTQANRDAANRAGEVSSVLSEVLELLTSSEETFDAYVVARIQKAKKILEEIDGRQEAVSD